MKKFMRNILKCCRRNKDYQDKQLEVREKLTNKIDNIIETKYSEDLDKYTDVNYLVKSMRRHDFIFRALLGDENFNLIDDYKKPVLIEY